MSVEQLPNYYAHSRSEQIPTYNKTWCFRPTISLLWCLEVHLLNLFDSKDMISWKAFILQLYTYSLMIQTIVYF